MVEAIILSGGLGDGGGVLLAVLLFSLASFLFMELFGTQRFGSVCRR